MESNDISRQKAAEIIANYRLEANPEGGFFSEVYTAAAAWDKDDRRPAGGSIYYLLPPGAVSRYHQIDCEEIWFYHAGCGLRLHIISPEGGVAVAKLGLNRAAGESPMAVVPQGAVFAAENITADGYTFVSCVTLPKFRYSGFRLVPYAEIAKYGAERRLCDS